MKFYCIADEDTVRGFRLAGVEGRAVRTAKEAEAALTGALADADVGIVILTERVAADLRRQVGAVRTGRDRPLVVEIPGPEGPTPGRKTLRRFVQEAIGISVGRDEGTAVKE
ncbi:MAG: Vacuolar H+transporting two-sector ATPase F subunit [Planctomycetes bacterium]|nr:Vacuolar H+transporting two-sector ATPase F subunit [Planctomycetota bacterium]